MPGTIQERRPGNLRTRQATIRLREPRGATMTCLKLTLPASDTVLAVLTLQHVLTAQKLLELEHAVAGTLAMLGRELGGAGVGSVHEHDASRTDAAEIEYASWMPDRGAIEVASWAAHMQSPGR
jgi:hypothetical protein